MSASQLRLQAAYVRAREAWPELELDPARFAAYVGARLADGADPEALRVDDLYLACACADHTPEGLAAFERHCMPIVDTALRRLDATGALADEIKQQLREMLFVGRPGSSPKIVEYGGRGDLRGWLRVTAVRMARKQLARARGTRTISDEAAELVADRSTDPELAAFKQRYRDEFKRAIQDALAAASPEARNLLRHHLLDGLSLTEIACVYHVDKATISRRLAKVRAALASATRRTLRARHQLTGSEVESLARLVESELEASLARLLGTSEPA